MQNQSLCLCTYQIYVMMSSRCQSKLQMRVNRLITECQAIKENFPINSQTCFVLTQEESSQQKKQPFGDLRKNFNFSAWCFFRNFLINLGAFLFRNNAKWLLLKQCLTRHSIIRILLSTKTDSYGFFSHLKVVSATLLLVCFSSLNESTY